MIYTSFFHVVYSTYSIKQNKTYCIYQTSEYTEYPFSHALIGYSSLGYLVISTGLQNTRDTCVSIITLSKTDKITFVVVGYSLIWHKLKQFIHLSVNE